jgi:hypothetical protein
MNRLLSSALISSLLLAGGAHAQNRRNDWERKQDNHEVRQDKRELRDDRRDVAELEAVLARFDKAWSQQNEQEMYAVEERLRQLLHAELAEGRAELARDQGEARRSQREVHGSRREARQDWGWKGRADDRRDVRDDRRDLKDDRRDVRAEAASQMTRLNIARELSRVMGSRQPQDLQHSRALIVQLIQVAQHEVRETKQEVREDRQERREDRRERREDRRR